MSNLPVAVFDMGQALTRQARKYISKPQAHVMQVKVEKIAQLLDKYLKDELSPEERPELDKWIASDEQNKLLFQDIINKKILAEALRFVQSDIRYVSISIGTNSHRPYAPAVVLHRRYGDCKDKSALLVTILRDLGINAKPVLVSVSYRKGFGDWLPSPKLFDHAIVRVELDGRQYWLDPTALQNAKNIETFGYLHGEKDVLVVDSSSVDLYTIPVI